MSATNQVLGLALVGAGLFARDAYSGLLKRLEGEIALRAVWSRSEKSAAKYVAQYASNAEALFGDAGLDAVYANPQIDVVLVILPVQAMTDVVQRALASGKHVIQEKPIGPTAAQAAAAIHSYRQVTVGGPLWMFAENYRFEGVFLAARRVVNLLGPPIKLDLVADLPMDENNKYFSSAWRRDLGACPGGFLMESSVHFIAALRLLAAAAGLGQACNASALAHQASPALSPPDTLVGVVRFSADTDAGFVPASVSISLAAPMVRWTLTLVARDGCLLISRGGWGGSRGMYTLSWQKKGSPEPHVTQHAFSGLERELTTFAQLVRAHTATSTAPAFAPRPAPYPAAEGGGDPASLDLDTDTVARADAGARSVPEEGLADLVLVEALLASAQRGGELMPVVQA